MLYYSRSKNLNKHVLKNGFQIQQRGTLGLFAPDPNQVTSAIGVQRGRSAWILIQWINISVGRAAALGEILWCRVRGTNRR